jgi:hypothetical protein
MPRPKKSTKEFNQYLIDFDFYFLTSFTKQKSMIKLQLFSDKKSPDESVSYVYSIINEAFKLAFSKVEFNKNTVRFRGFTYLPTLTGDLAKQNLGLTDASKIKALSTILKKHLLA